MFVDGWSAAEHPLVFIEGKSKNARLPNRLKDSALTINRPLNPAVFVLSVAAGTVSQLGNDEVLF